MHTLKDMSSRSNRANEYAFWHGFIQHRLGSHLDSTAREQELKGKLKSMKNRAVLTLFVINAMWLVLILILNGSSAHGLKLLGTNPLGVAFLIVYGLLFVIQFLCMLVHRYGTLMQYVASVSVATSMDMVVGMRDDDVVAVRHDRFERL